METNLFGTPSLITRNTNDVQQVQMVVVMALNVMVLAPIMCVGGIIMALREDVPLSALLVVIIPLMVLVIGILVVRAMPLFRAMQVKIDRINQVMRETLERHPGHPGVRADGPRGGAVRRGQPRPHRDVPPGQPPLRPHDPDALRAS